MKSEIPKILNKKFGRATINKDSKKFFIHLLLTNLLDNKIISIL